MNTIKKSTQHKYIVLFRGRYCIDVRIDAVPKSYIAKLRKVKLTKSQIEDGFEIGTVLYQKVLNENNADELHIFGIAEHGMIQVFELPGSTLPNIDKLGKPIFEDDGIEKVKVKTETPKPKPNSTIVGCVCNEDGVMGHIELNLKSKFDPKKLTLIKTSGEAFVTDSAITGLKYTDGKDVIEAKIDESEYLNAYPKVELFFCSDINAKGKEVALFENGEWRE